MNKELKNKILEIAWESIKYGLKNQNVLPVNLQDYHPELKTKKASFVTLEKNNNLRGCIGSIEAYQPLVKDIVDNAYNAAFRDPRFEPLNVNDLNLNLTLSISILSEPQKMEVKNENDLLNQLIPFKDGLILKDAPHSSTFLPVVWESLPDKKDFILQLKLKAGLPVNYWSENLKFYRYFTETIK